jgi:hypothetical protein
VVQEEDKDIDEEEEEEEEEVMELQYSGALLDACEMYKRNINDVLNFQDFTLVSEKS